MCLITDRLSVVECLIVIRVIFESVTKAGLLGSEDSRTGTLPFLGVSGGRIFGEGITLTFSQMNQTQINPSPPSQKSTLLQWQAGAQ